MKDKNKYYSKIEKDIISIIYDESLENEGSYYDKFIDIAKNFKHVEPYMNYIERCVMANDVESLIYLILSNKIVKLDNKLFNVIDNCVTDELSEKLSLDIIRILISNKHVGFAMKIMTNELYYKVHFLKDLLFLDNSSMRLYLYGQSNFPVYFINQFNDLELEEDKENVLDTLINYYNAVLDEVKNYYHSHIENNTLILEYPCDSSKSDKKIEFKFLDLGLFNSNSLKIAKLRRIENKIKSLVRKGKEYVK